MSVYTTTYYSASRDRVWQLEEMHSAHLCQAVRKLQRGDDGLNAGLTPDQQEDLTPEQKADHLRRLTRDMLAEVAARELDLQYPTGKPPQPAGEGNAIQ